MAPEKEDFAALLARVRSGDVEARDRLITLAYPELKRLARMLMSREQTDHNLSWTGSALVNELYASRLGTPAAARELANAKDLTDVLRIAARDMGQIMVDHVRARNAEKRPPRGKREPLEKAELAEGSAIYSHMYSLEVQKGLDDLRQMNAEAAEAVELRYSFGFTVKEAAAIMRLAPGTFRGRLAYGETWLADYFLRNPIRHFEAD